MTPQNRFWWQPATTTDLPAAGNVIRSRRTIAATIVALAAALATMVGIATYNGPSQITPYRNGTMHTPTLNALAAGCNDRFVTAIDTGYPDGTVPPHPDEAPEPEPNAAVASLADVQWSAWTTAPVRGIMYETAATVNGKRFWAPSSDTATGDPTAHPLALLRDMWNGSLVIYYDDRVPENEITRLREIQQLNPDLDLIVAHWPGSGSFPRGRKIALAAWGTVQYCMVPALPAITDFREEAPKGDAPGATGTLPPVVLTSWGPEAANDIMTLKQTRDRLASQR